MKITQFTDFSVRLLIYLAKSRDRVVTVREIADHHGISAEHLKKVVRRLSELGYITTVRGKRGGLRIARDPGVITLGRIMREQENLSLLPCDGEDENCPLDSCRLKDAVERALSAFLAELDRETLADLA